MPAVTPGGEGWDEGKRKTGRVDPCSTCGGQGVVYEPSPTESDSKNLVKCDACNGHYYWSTDK